MRSFPLIAFVTLLLVLGQNVNAATWWNASWLKSQTCAINSTVNATLTDFPALCVMDTASLISAGKMKSDCSDLRVVNSTNESVLSYEIANNTCNTTATEIYIRIPSLIANVSNNVFIYYNNSAATDAQNKTDVWLPSGYTMVMHMGDLIDSAQPTLLFSNAGCDLTTGRFGIANTAYRCYDNSKVINRTQTNMSSGKGASNMFAIFYTNTLPASSYRPIVMLYPKAEAGYMRRIAIERGTGGYCGAAGNYTNTKVEDASTGSDLCRSMGANLLNTWQAVSQDYNSNTSHRSFNNGTQIGVTTYTATGTSWTAQILIGGYASANSGFNGTIDEVRISANLNRSLDWMIAEENQKASMGNEQPFIPVMITSTILPSPAYTSASLTGWCNATTGDGSNVTYNYTWYLNGVVNTSGNTSSLTQGVNTNVANVSNTSLLAGDEWILQCTAYNSNGASSLNSSATIIQGYSAVGCTITTDGNYTVHTCLSNTTFNVTGRIANATVLVVAGGGAGGHGGTAEPAGGGGAGGLIYNTSYVITGNISVIVGIGGTDADPKGCGGNGTNSSFGILIAIGGGGGNGGGGAGAVQSTACSGGSGGGGNGYNNRTGGNGTAGQGYNGGNGTTNPNYAGGGGGGAGGLGANGSGIIGGVGGIGLNYSINGSNINYSCGGGGASWTGGANSVGGCSSGGIGGKKGGTTAGTAGLNGTGGGGGGGVNTAAGGAGGSGIVIIRYLTSQSEANVTTGPYSMIGNATHWVWGTLQTGNITISGNATEWTWRTWQPGSGRMIRNGTYTTSVATGGTITYDGAYTVHTFTSNGTFNVTGAIPNATVLVVAGGGGGGSAKSAIAGKSAGGGGAGGLLYNESLVLSAVAYTVVVGAGGTGSTTVAVNGVNGQNSSFANSTLNLSAVGGGGGGSNVNAAPSTENNGSAGGSGGGGAGALGGTAGSGGAGTAGQGYTGGNGYIGDPGRGGGGGGGAGEIGKNGSSSAGGNGGVGANYSINGTSICYAGGGGGGVDSGVAGNGSCGGGNGGARANGASASANTGSGGGGAGGDTNKVGGAGGSGIIIVRYLTQTVTVAITSGTPTSWTWVNE